MGFFDKLTGVGPDDQKSKKTAAPVKEEKKDEKERPRWRGAYSCQLQQYDYHDYRSDGQHPLMVFGRRARL